MRLGSSDHLDLIALQTDLIIQFIEGLIVIQFLMIETELIKLSKILINSEKKLIIVIDGIYIAAVQEVVICMPFKHALHLLES